MLSTPTTFPTQLQDWLNSYPGLSESAKLAYRGEVNRLAEFMAGLGIRGARQMREAHWLDYLGALMQNRTAIASRRRAALRVTSALQAARITRLFLRHCYVRGWIGWVPLGPRRCRVERAPRETRLTRESVELLFGPTPENEEWARALAAISLAFWATMNPREIAAARRSHLCEVTEQGAEIIVPGRPGPVMLPAIALRHLNAYHRLRRELRAEEAADEGVPLVSQIGTYEPLTGHRIWTLLKVWPPDATAGKVQLVLGARALRDSFLTLATRAPMSELVAVRRQTGRSGMQAFQVAEESCPLSFELVQHIADSLSPSV